MASDEEEIVLSQQSVAFLLYKPKVERSNPEKNPRITVPQQCRRRESWKFRNQFNAQA